MPLDPAAPRAAAAARRALAGLLLAGLVGATAACQSAPPPLGDEDGILPPLTVSFADPEWTGQTIPVDQVCRKFGGQGDTPPLTVANVPANAARIVVSFNDANYPPLSSNGGHGKIGFTLPPGVQGTVTLPSMPGETNTLPRGATVVAPNRATGFYATEGYLPPCSGGNGNTYFAVVTAMDAANQPLARGRITLGQY